MVWCRLLLLLSLHILLAVATSAASRANIKQLRSRIESEQLPIFQFARDMGELLSQELASEASTSSLELLDCEILFADYIGRLRDFYSSRFRQEVLRDFEGNIPALAERKAFYVKECQIAMQASVPKQASCSSWSYSGYLSELEKDIDQMIREKTDSMEIEGSMSMDPSTATASSSRPSRFAILNRARSFWRRHKWMRWVLSQSVLLFANWAQSEVVSIF